MRQRDFDYGWEGRRDEQRGGGRDGGEGSRGERTWYREGRWELPADQDLEWRRRGTGQSFDEGPFAGRGPRGYRRSDHAIFEEVCERLTAHGYIDATEIDVDVKQGIVTLTGTAPDRRQKRLAEETIESVAGVQDVSNQLRLVGHGAEATAGPAGEAGREEEIGRKETDRKEEIGRKETDRREEIGRKDEARAEQQAQGPQPRIEREQPGVERAGPTAYPQPMQSPQPTHERDTRAAIMRDESRQPVGVMDRDRGELPTERRDETPPDRIGQSDLEATRIRPATKEHRLQAGAPVYGREGDKIGEVAEGSGDHFVVHKGLIFATELYFPAASILRSDENGVQVDISKEDLEKYKERPTAAHA